MAIRDLLRGDVPDEQLEVVEDELARRYDREAVQLEPLQADNWLSVPYVVDEEWFVKVLTPQHSLIHAIFTAGRNLGAFTSGTEGFFEHVGGPLEMAQRELAATESLRSIGVGAPAPIEAFGVDEVGVLLLEYIPDFTTLDHCSNETRMALASDVFRALRSMHENGLAHGDLRAENVLVVDGALLFIDATSVRSEAIEDARAYDLASALSMLEPLLGAREAVFAAGTHYNDGALLDAREFLDFVGFRPDHDSDPAAIKSAIDRRATSPPLE